MIQCRQDHEIQFKADKGIHRIELSAAIPDTDGIITRLPLQLPEYDEGYFFTGDTLEWPTHSNRVQAWAFGKNIEEPFKINKPIPGVFNPEKEGYALVLKEKTGKYLYILGLTTAETTSRFTVKPGGEVVAEVVTWGTEKVLGNIPVLTWARSEDFYEASYEVWLSARSEPGIKDLFRLREEKPYPEVFDYLGWCSWEHYKKEINEEVIDHAYRTIVSSVVPVRWILIDDGHQDDRDMQLISFNPSREKFPNGWDFLTGNDRSGKIRWVGLWHSFNGHWRLIHKENEMQDISFVPASNSPHDNLKVKADSVTIVNFYDKMIRSVRDQGFDFVKIDVQGSNMMFNRGEKNAVQTNYWSSQALEDACDRYLDGLINCMCMNSVCLFNTPKSNVSRVSVDYKLGDLEKAKSHIYQSYASSIWFGYIAYPDHDMFHSSDSICGKMMAVSKALSCGPIYLSDAPGDFAEDYITPLCYSDGKLLKPLAPAVPLQQSLLKDVFGKPNVFSVIAPLPHKCAAIASYNLTHPSTKLSASIGSDDYSQASAMLQPYTGRWDVPEQGLVVFDFYAMKGSKLEKKFNYEMDGFSDRFFIVSPIQMGWAVIGSVDKYLSPSAIKSVDIKQASVEIGLFEGDNFVFWSDETPHCSGNELTSLGNGIWLADLHPGQKSIRIEK